MPLAPGDRLGPYEIVSQIGAGGMGEVYKARDTRLDRIVALKTSKVQFSERFEREARAVAALNHPNICTLYDVGPDFLVMEFVEGASPKGPLPLEEVLRSGRQIAAALAEAHEKHITHRDLKPGNILIKPDGSVKVLDFGLAKLSPPARADVSPDNSPTLTMTMTEAGMILGTAAYMAPEQAKGKEVDKRADIWAFGVVLYELLTGQRPFQGGDVSEVLASVIKEQPSYEGIPRQARRLIERCLEKDPAKRLRDIGDVWDLLDQGSPDAAVPVKRQGKLWPVVAGVASVAAAALGFLLLRQPDRPREPLRRLELSLPVTLTDFLRLSPDAQSIAYTTSQGIWVRRLDSREARLLPGTDNITNGSWFWSPDNRFIAFLAGREGERTLRRIDVNGGPALPLAQFGAGFGGPGFWSQQGVILLSGTKGISRTSTSGGVVVAATIAGPDTLGHVLPLLLPDGRHFLYSRVSRSGRAGDLMLGDLTLPADKQPTTALVTGIASNPRDFIQYLAESAHPNQGVLLFKREDSLLAQPFDAGALQVTGEAMPLSDEPVMLYSAAGNLLAFTRATGREGQLTWFDRLGKQTEVLGSPAFQFAVALSPDGQRLAVERAQDLTNSTSSVWIVDAKTNAATRIPGDGHVPVWSPDGTEVIYTAFDDDPSTRSLFRAPANGSAQPHLFLKSDRGKSTYAQSWFGKTLLVADASDILSIDTSVDGAKPQPYLTLPRSQMNAQFSPDGRWVAYASDDSGRYEVYVSSYPDPSQSRVTISTGGGTRPRWSRDGRQLLYLDPEGTLVSLTVSALPQFKVGERATLGNVRPRPGSNIRGNVWDIAPDGRFLVNMSTEDGRNGGVSILVNWQRLLSR